MKKYAYLIKLTILIVVSLIILGLQRALSQNGHDTKNKSLIEVVD